MRSRIWWWIAPTWSTLVAAYFLFGPSYGAARSTVTGSAGAHTVYGHTSGFSVNGASMILPLSTPIVMALVPLFVRDARTRREAGFLMSFLLFLLCMLSLGLYFVPSSLALAVAAGRMSSASPMTP